MERTYKILSMKHSYVSFYS